MNWTKLKNIPAWTRMGEIDLDLIELGDGIFKVMKYSYLRTVDYNQNFEGIEGEFFITEIMWAQSDGAAKRAFLSEIENDEFNEQIPPIEMQLEANKYRYSDILESIKTGKYGAHIESASYRIAIDGHFIHRELSLKDYEFYFRSRKKIANEIPYAISFALQGEMCSSPYLDPVTRELLL